MAHLRFHFRSYKRAGSTCTFRARTDRLTRFADHCISITMQTLSSYLLETPSLGEDELARRFVATQNSITEWLKSKGAPNSTAGSGKFESLTKDGSGSFTRTKHVVPIGTLEIVRLEEFTRAGQIFTTQVTTTASSNRLRIHCTLSVANAASVVAPLPIDPRCPSIIRTLLEQSGDWKLNGSNLSQPKPRHFSGKLGGEKLSTEIQDTSRSIPIVVVSEIEDEQVWPDLAGKLAYDLAGLAHVVIIDDEATWRLSESIGKLHSCYRGAVRLYWPPRERSDGSVHFNSTVWTASDLLSNDRDGKGLQRLRATLRRILMSTAALSITLPAAVREIQDAVSRIRIEELERRAAPNSEELAIARLYIAECHDLRTKIKQLESDLARAAARADAAEHSLGQLKAPALSEEDTSQSITDSNDPKPGDVRYYKKTHSKSAYDVLVEVDDCGHTSWQGSTKADKAKKGLERLTHKNSWKSLQHCGTCTGGGMWKVRW